MDRGLQEIVDALSLSLGRPVLIDDAELRPLAYSTQFGELDRRAHGEHPRPARARRRARGAVRRGHPHRRRAGAHPRAAGDRHARAGLRPARRRRDAGSATCGCSRSRRSPRPSCGSRAPRRPRPPRSSVPTPTPSSCAAATSSSSSSSLLSADPRQVETAATALEAEHYLPLRPVCVWVAAPAEPAGEEWSAEALDRLRARLAAKQAMCAELDGRLVCLAGVRGLAGNAVMEALGALSAPRALVGQGEAVEDLRDAAHVATAVPWRRCVSRRTRSRAPRAGTRSASSAWSRRSRTPRWRTYRRAAPAAGRRPGARADARGLPRPRGRRQAHRGGAVPAPRRALLPPAPDRGGRRA